MCFDRSIYDNRKPGWKTTVSFGMALVMYVEILLYIPPPPRNLEIDVLAIYMLLNMSICYQMLFGNFVPDCIRSNLRGSKLKIFLQGILPDPSSRHARLLYATIILLPSCFPPHLKILYETLFTLYIYSKPSENRTD